jgi:hypothetical protein
MVIASAFEAPTMSIDRFFRRPMTSDEWRSRARAIQSQLEGLSIDELLRGATKRSEPSGSGVHDYDPLQPRVPAGHPDGGQWTSGGASGGGINDPRVISDVTPDNDWMPGADYAGIGHHFFPRASWSTLPLPADTRRVFDRAVSGPLAPKAWSKRRNTWLQHRYDAAHREYSAAVDELFQNYVRRHHIRSRRMTPEQAEKFIEAIHNSSDLRIRRYNEMIKTLRRLYRSPRGNE